MEDNMPDPNPELLTAKLLQVEEMMEEDEEFRHLNNPADGIKPIVKKYLGVPNHAEKAGNKIYFYRWRRQS